jgi:hypothetical protein
VRLRLSEQIFVEDNLTLPFLELTQPHVVNDGPDSDLLFEEGLLIFDKSPERIQVILDKVGLFQKISRLLHPCPVVLLTLGRCNVKWVSHDKDELDRRETADGPSREQVSENVLDE